MDRLKDLDKMIIYHENKNAGRLNPDTQDVSYGKKDEREDTIGEHDQQESLDKFETIWNKKYKIENKVALSEMEHILDIPETESISATNIALEIVLQNKKFISSMFPYFVVLNIINSALPFLVMHLEGIEYPRNHMNFFYS